MADARDILGIEHKDASTKQRKVKRLSDASFKKPEGMHRELYALLQSDYRDPPSLVPTDTGSSYRQPKAKIGRSRVRPWKWMSFENGARNDGLVLHHWRRKADEGKEYPFAKFGESKFGYTYTDEEYNLHLYDESGNWSREETDCLFELSRKFDRRFTVMMDRYDEKKYPNRLMEDLKERYYNVVKRLIIARTPPGQEPQDVPPAYDCEHEKNRKEQLVKLFNRTPDEVEEEETLIQDLKKIELRKKDREKKSQDLNKLITAAENKPVGNTTMADSGGGGATQVVNQDIRHGIKKDKKAGKKNKKRRSDSTGESKSTKDTPGIKFPEIKGSGVFLRSSKLKMPPSVGTKKSKAVEQLLEELSVDIIPMPTEDICQHFNELRNQLLLLYELKQAMGNCEYESQTLKVRYEIMCPGKKVSDLIGFSLDMTDSTAEDGTSSVASSSGSQLLIDSVAPLAALSSRKRRTAAALLETNPWKKTKKT